MNWIDWRERVFDKVRFFSAPKGFRCDQCGKEVGFQYGSRLYQDGKRYCMGCAARRPEDR